MKREDTNENIVFLFSNIFVFGEVKSSIMKNNDFPSLSSNDLGACSVPACLPSPRFCTYLFCIILYFPTGSFCLQIIYVLFTSQHQSSRKYTSCSDSYLSRRLAVSQFITWRDSQK